MFLRACLSIPGNFNYVSTAPQLGNQEKLKMTHPDSLIPPFLKSVQYKKMLAILMGSASRTFSWFVSYWGNQVCFKVASCFYFLDHPNKSEMPLELPHWLVYLSVAWKFWRQMQQFEILWTGTSLQLDSLWHFRISSNLGNTVLLPWPAQCNENKGRLNWRYMRIHPWFLWLGRPQNSAWMVWVVVKSGEIRPPGFKVFLFHLVAIWLWEGDLSYLSKCLPIWVPGFLLLVAKFHAYESPFPLEFLSPKGIFQSQTWWEITWQMNI